jgi:hypothetical protein
MEFLDPFWVAFFWFVMSPRGARFLAKWGATAVAFPTLSVDEEDACLFARDDDVEDENDERRVCVDIFNKKVKTPLGLQC